LRGIIFAKKNTKYVNLISMNCPVCNNSTLMMSERQGIEIDYCPNCRGVWLDRGELDKIIERSGNGDFSQKRSDDRFRRDSDDPTHGYKKKKESFIGDLFDF
jgi:uncharacterized protein